MQRRNFRLEGKSVLAARDGGFFEAHGTLVALIQRHAVVSAKRCAGMDGLRPRDSAPAIDAEPMAASRPEPVQANRPGADPPTGAADPSPTPCSQKPTAEAAEPWSPRDGAAASVTDANAEDATPARETGA